jgi:hypothetical protein
MSARIERNIAVLVAWVAVACMGARYLPAQSPSGSQAQIPSAPSRDQKTSKGEHGAAPRMASQWTAGAQSFGPAGDQSWGKSNTSFGTESGAMWNPGTERFGVSVQPGGIWQSRGQQSMRNPEPTSQNSSQGMNQSSTGNPSQGMNQSTSGNSSSIGSSDGLPSNNRAAPSTEPGMKSISTLEDAFQELHQSTTGSRFSSSPSVGMRSISPQMKLELLHSAGAIGIEISGRNRSPHSPGSRFDRSSSGLFAGKTASRRGYRSSSFGTGRTVSRRALRSSSHRDSSRRSLFGSTLGERDYSSGLGTQQTRPGLGRRMGEQDQELGPRGFDRNLRKRESGNGTHHPVGSTLDSNQDLQTNNPR